MIVLRDLRDEVTSVFAREGGNPRVHPNGFIQLDLEPVPASWHASHQRGHSGASRRLHIWNPPGIELPHQDTYNEVHDHVFDMESEVVRGALWQHLYELVDDPASDAPLFEAYRAVYEKNSDSRLEPTGARGVLREVERFLVPSGETYTQPAFTLHDSVPDQGGCVVTVMTKSAIHDGDATVVCPADQPPDNDFDRAAAAPADEIWQAIWQSLRVVL